MTSLKIVDVRSGLYRLPILSSPTSKVPVGYESLPAFLIQHPCDTFVIRANRGFELYSRIHPDDLLVVDRATEPLDGDIAIAVADGEFVIKRVELLEDRLMLVPEDISDRLNAVCGLSLTVTQLRFFTMTSLKIVDVRSDISRSTFCW